MVSGTCHAERKANTQYHVQKGVPNLHVDVPLRNASLQLGYQLQVIRINVLEVSEYGLDVGGEDNGLALFGSLAEGLEEHVNGHAKALHIYKLRGIDFLSHLGAQRWYPTDYELQTTKIG